MLFATTDWFAYGFMGVVLLIAFILAAVDGKKTESKDKKKEESSGRENPS